MAREISGRYLPDDKRARATAEQTGRSPSTISRVLRRNQDRAAASTGRSPRP